MPFDLDRRIRAGDRVLAIGDSLIAGFNVAAADNLPSRLGQLLQVSIFNAGINGDTSCDLLYRLRATLKKERFAHVLVCIGGNDLLRGLSEQALEHNLTQVVQQIRSAQAEPVLLAVPYPGSTLDHPVYRRVAQATGARLTEGLAAQLTPRHFQLDQIHPNAHGYHALAAHLARVL